MTNQTVKPYKSWDLPTRLFHWINFLCVIVLSLLGLIMLNKGSIGHADHRNGTRGTDIYYPPLGKLFASQVAAQGVSPADIKPYDKTGTDETKLAEMQAFKKPFGQIHVQENRQYL